MVHSLFVTNALFLCWLSTLAITELNELLLKHSVQCKFVSNISCKQARMSFIQVVSHLIQAVAYVSLAQNPLLKQATAYVRGVLGKIYHLYCKFVSYVSNSLCNLWLIFFIIVNGPVALIDLTLLMKANLVFWAVAPSYAHFM